jgi:phosphoribosyl 1,2-cyclic phosphodiesterase
MAKIVILGSSAEFPLPRTKTNKFEDYLDITGYQHKFGLHNDPLCNSAKKGNKDRRTRSAMALLIGGKTILFDAGPDIRYQLRKHHLKPDAVFVSHEHPDANYGLNYLRGLHPVKSSEAGSAERLFHRAKIFSEKLGNVKRGVPISVFGVEILPFRVKHSKIAPYTGYKVLLNAKRSTLNAFAYITDMASTAGIQKYVQGCDILFADGSIINRNLFGHMAIPNQLAVYKKWRLKRVIFTHIGHRTPLHEDLVKYIKGRYKNADVAYDGMVIRLK